MQLSSKRTSSKYKNQVAFVSIVHCGFRKCHRISTTDDIQLHLPAEEIPLVEHILPQLVTPWALQSLGIPWNQSK